MNSTTDINKFQRIQIHLRCRCKNWQQLRFHLAGVIREFVPQRWQRFIS
jgi:hypothetical protein